MAAANESEEKNRLICSLCNHFVENVCSAKCSPCGHLYCSQCINIIFRMDCDVAAKNAKIDPELAKLEVSCTKGCEGKFKFDDFKCCEKGMKLVWCPWRCGIQFKPEEKDEHFEKFCEKRVVDCVECGETMQFDLLEDHIKKTCKSFHIPCPHGCDQQNLPRVQMISHARSCINCYRECDFYPLGCLIKGDGPFVSKHEEDYISPHLNLIRDFTIKQKEKLNFTSEKLDAYFEALQSENSKLVSQIEFIRSEKDEEIEKLKTEFEKRLESLEEKVKNLEKFMN